MVRDIKRFHNNQIVKFLANIYDTTEDLFFLLPLSLKSIHCKFSSAPSHDHKVFRLVNLRLRTRAVPSSLLFARDYKVTADVKFDKPRSGLAVYKCTIQKTGEYVVFSNLQIKSMMNKVKDEQN